MLCCIYWFIFFEAFKTWNISRPFRQKITFKVTETNILRHKRMKIVQWFSAHNSIIITKIYLRCFRCVRTRQSIWAATFDTGYCFSLIWYFHFISFLRPLPNRVCMACWFPLRNAWKNHGKEVPVSRSVLLRHIGVDEKVEAILRPHQT